MQPMSLYQPHFATARRTPQSDTLTRAATRAFKARWARTKGAALLFGEAARLPLFL